MSLRTPAGVLSVRAYLGVMTAAYAVASALGLGLTWDGAYYLFQPLNNGVAMAPFNRLVDLPLQQPVIFARSVTDNPTVLAAIFSFSYLLVPLASLAGSWLVVRKRQPRLFVWSVLGIGLFSLPGQAAIQSEAIMAVQLAWPIVLAVLTGEPSEQWDIVLLFSIVLALTHPLAVPLFAGVAVTVALLHSAHRPRGRPELWWMAVFAFFAGLAWLRTAGAELGSTHTQELSLGPLGGAFGNSVLGAPLLMLAIAYAGGVLLVAGSALRRLRATTWARATETFAFALFTLAGIVLVPWAADVHAWWKALDYRFFTLFFAVPLMGLAFLDTLLQSPSTGDASDAGSWTRRWIVGGQALIVFAVMAAFAVSFHGLQTQLASDLGPNARPCVTLSSLQWAKQTALDHWAVAPDSLLIQGRTPAHVVLPACSVHFSEGLPLTSWQTNSYEGGWFDLSKLEGGLLKSGPK